MSTFAATVLAYAGMRRGESVVDVACGDGLLVTAAAAGAAPDGRAYGVESDPADLEHARRRATAVHWLRADRSRLPFPAGMFDKAISARATDEEAVLEEMARVLLPGGRAVVWASTGVPLPELVAAAGFRVVHVEVGEIVVVSGSTRVR